MRTPSNTKRMRQQSRNEGEVSKGTRGEKKRPVRLSLAKRATPISPQRSKKERRQREKRRERILKRTECLRGRHSASRKYARTLRNERGDARKTRVFDLGRRAAPEKLWAKKTKEKNCKRGSY